MNTYGAYQTYYYNTLLFGTSDSAISWIGSVQGFLLCTATIFAGFACDSGHTRATLFFGTVLVVFGLMMTSLCSAYWQLMLAQGICVGIGGGCCFITSVFVLPTYFTSRRALAIGLSSAGSSIGGVVYTIMFHNLQPTIGSGWATRTIAFISLATLAFSCATLRPRPVKPKEGGLRRLFDVSAFADPSFTLFSLAAFLSFIGLFIPFFYIEQYALDVAHLPSELSFYALPLLSVGSIFGRVAPSLLAKRFGGITVLAGCTFTSAVLVFAWFGIEHAAGIIVFALLYGFFSGAFVSLRTQIVVAITPKEQAHKLGARMGVNLFCAALGLLVGNPIAGVLVRGKSGWDGLKGFCGGTILLGFASLVVAAYVARRRSLE